MKKLNVAVVGTGFMGMVHLEAWRYVKNANVVYVVSRNSKKSYEVASKYGVDIITDYEAALKRRDVDIIDICVPTYLHMEYAEKALENNKHVLLEKPIANTLEDAEKIVRKASKSTVKLMVLHVLRYFSEYREARNAVKEGQIGDIRHMRAIRRGAFPTWGEWYSDPCKSGGVTVDLAIHDVDFFLWCMNDKITKVYCKENKIRKNEIPDHAIIIIHFRNSAIAHIEAGWNMPPNAPFTMSMEIYGTGGMIRYNNLDRFPIELITDNGYTKHAPNTLPYSPSILPFPIDPYTAELQEFINSIINDVDIPISAEEALESLKICLTARRSAELGKPIII